MCLHIVLFAYIISALSESVSWEEFQEFFFARIDCDFIDTFEKYK